jgi:hypothetical protein
MLRVFPMILIAVAAYNALVYGGLAMGHDAAAVLGQSVTVATYSGDVWKLTVGDGLLTLTLLLLFVETINAARTSHRAILGHGLAMLTFAGALTEFITLKGFGTSPFFLITAMCLFDVVAGYTISIIAARRDLSVPPVDGS